VLASPSRVEHWVNHSYQDSSHFVNAQAHLQSCLHAFCLYVITNSKMFYSYLISCSHTSDAAS
jgi:hypothetical protein